MIGYHRLHSCLNKRPPVRLCRLNKRRGFTILEVMLASVVLVTALCSSLYVLARTMRTIDYARCSTLAGQVLQSQMERLRLLNWSQFTDPTTGPVNFTSFSPDISAASAQLNRFTCTQSIVAAPSPFNATMKDVTLTAVWTGLDGVRHTLSYTTRYSQNGVSDFFYTVHN